MSGRYRRPQWITLGNAPTWDDSDRIDVAPVGDSIEHDTITDDCVCVPTVELVSTNPDSWMHVHHSLDGRELTEDSSRGEPVPDTPPGP